MDEKVMREKELGKELLLLPHNRILPTVVITKCHNLGGLNDRKFIFLQL
jgi:hypothetical protein